ncbi:MAG TPA: M28 family peptidase, partial [Bacilli bacterium]|nr:M28 family peptidase [Bacilli bacterium]
MNMPPIQTKDTPSQHSPSRWSGWLALTLFVVLLFTAVWSMRPASVNPADAPASEFSADRAMRDLEQIAAEIHPSGTPAHDRVRDYLVAQLQAMGLEPQVQKTTAVQQFDDQPFDKAATVENILVRLPGTGEGAGAKHKAVLLMAHYDSAISSYGANRDGSAVAAFLEVLRDLQAGPPLQNDVIVLFTDNEESYVMGVKGFVDEHPWAQDIDVAINFDSRGSSGPVVMFETSPENGWVVQQFADGTSHPLANSLLYALYDKLHYTSDFTVLKEQLGVTGLNFGYADETQHYHNALDDFASVDERSVQQLGEYALNLTRHFGNEDLSQTKEDNRVFFNVGSLLVTYSTAWVWPLTGLLVVLFVALLVFGLRRQQLRGKGFVVSLLVFPLLLIAGAGIAQVASMLVTAMRDPFTLINHDELFMVAFVGLALFATTGLLALFRKRLGTLNLMAGALFWWLLLTVGSALLLPGGHYLFAWPLLFGLLTLGHLLYHGEAHTVRQTLILGVLAAPTLLLVGQMMDMVLIMLGHGLPAVHGLFVALLVGALLPLLVRIMTPARNKWVWLPSLAVGVVTLAVALFLPAYSDEAPKSNSLMYGVDVDADKAYYATIDLAHDPFLQTYIGGGELTD